MRRLRIWRSGIGRRWNDVEFRDVAAGRFACDNLK